MLRSATLVAVMLLWSAAAFAQSPDHPYFSLAIGPNFADTLSGNGADVSTDAGPVGNAELGWALRAGLASASTPG